MGNKQNKPKKKPVEDNDDIYIFRREIYIPPLTDYKYFDRKMPYTTEELEISDLEQKRISELIPEQIDLISFPKKGESKIKVIIDTENRLG